MTPGDTDELVHKATNGDSHAQAALLGRLAERIESFGSEQGELKKGLAAIYKEIRSLDRGMRANTQRLVSMNGHISAYKGDLAKAATKDELFEHASREHASVPQTYPTKVAVKNSLKALRTEVLTRYDPIRALVLGGVGIILTTVFGGMVGAAIYFIGVIQGP